MGGAGGDLGWGAVGGGAGVGDCVGGCEAEDKVARMAVLRWELRLLVGQGFRGFFGLKVGRFWDGFG